jgi:hypothetical protein
MTSYSRSVLVLVIVASAVAHAQAGPPPAAASANDAARLVGVWEGRDRSEEGMGDTIEFRAGGTMTVSSGMMLNFQGKPVNDGLVAMVESVSGVPQEVRIRATGDRLSYIVGGVPQQWRRVDSPAAGQPAWAGVWAFESAAAPGHKRHSREDHEVEQLMRTNMRMAIAPDGAGRLRFPMNNENGAYLVQGEKLVLQYGGRVFVPKWHIEGNTLFLQYPDRPAASAFDRIH